MTRDVFHTIGCLIVVLLMMTSLLSPVSASDTDESSEEGTNDLKNFDILSRLVSNYMDSVRDQRRRQTPYWTAGAFSDNAKRSELWRKKRPCNLGIFSDGCRLSELDAALRRNNYLNGGTSPGKRSEGDSSFDLEQGTGMKRTCRLRLGGHCVTEAMDKAAAQYHYLNSADSPGRRRRSVQETQQFVRTHKSTAQKRSRRHVMDPEGR